MNVKIDLFVRRLFDSLTPRSNPRASVRVVVSIISYREEPSHRALGGRRGFTFFPKSGSLPRSSSGGWSMVRGPWSLGYVVVVPSHGSHCSVDRGPLSLDGAESSSRSRGLATVDERSARNSFVKTHNIRPHAARLGNVRLAGSRTRYIESR